MSQTNIFTKTGDKGKTSLATGKRIWKDDQRIKSCGVLDELNSWCGLIISFLNVRHSGKVTSSDRIQNPIHDLFPIQSDLMFVSSILANPNVETRHSVSLRKQTKFLESWIDQKEKNLPPLRNFIISGGSLLSSYLHITRSVCRRAEREIVTLSRKEKIIPEILIYLNRLSDFLFVLARYINKKEGFHETLWTKDKSK